MYIFKYTFALPFLNILSQTDERLQTKRLLLHIIPTHFFLILRRRHTHLRLEAFTKITRVVDSDHI